MKVMIVYGAPDFRALTRKVAPHEVAECDLVIGLNEEGSEGVVLKDRYGKTGNPVKVVS
jgi:ATP-dependent RNA circularization protein (DNA/RNA ligase family)